MSSIFHALQISLYPIIIPQEAMSALNPKRTVAELKELRSMTGDENGAQRIMASRPSPSVWWIGRMKKARTLAKVCLAPPPARGT
jgi:hypothetical protein